MNAAPPLVTCQVCASRAAVHVRTILDGDDPDPVRVCASCRDQSDRHFPGRYGYVPVRQADPASAPPAPPPPPALDYAGGRVSNRHPDTARAAAASTPAGRQREDVHARLVLAGAHGRLADEIARVSGLPPNQIASRLQELWEAGRAAVARERGSCRFAVCATHRPPDAVHYPQDPCDVHGTPRKRDTSRGRAAAVWLAAGREDPC